MNKGIYSDVRGLWAEGATIREIAMLTGLPRGQVEYILRGEAEQPKKQRTERRCMCCGSKFASEGPHNRLCSKCRGQSLSTFEAERAVLL